MEPKTPIPREVYGGAIYAPGYVQPHHVLPVMNELKALQWETKTTARHEYFASDELLTYRYGNRPEPYIAKPLTGILPLLLDMTNATMGTKFNALFLNKYDNERQHLGWHADDFDGMDQNQPIAVISLGAEREIWLKLQKQDCPQCQGTGNWPPHCRQVCNQCHGKREVPVTGQIPPEQKIKLENGSLFVMPVGYQSLYYHRIPKHSMPCGERISITFRSFLPQTS